MSLTSHFLSKAKLHTFCILYEFLLFFQLTALWWWITQWPTLGKSKWLHHKHQTEVTIFNPVFWERGTRNYHLEHHTAICPIKVSTFKRKMQNVVEKIFVIHAPLLNIERLKKMSTWNKRTWTQAGNYLYHWSFLRVWTYFLDSSFEILLFKVLWYTKMKRNENKNCLKILLEILEISLVWA